VSAIQQRTTQVADRVKVRPRPRVAVLEWTDPPFAPGHWIPEMVWLAGGDPVIGVARAASRRISWDDVKAAQPDVVVVAACGYDRQATTVLVCDLTSRGVLPRGFGWLRWMRTRPGRGRAPAWLTVLRSLPISSTRRPTRPWPSAKTTGAPTGPPPGDVPVWQD